MHIGDAVGDLVTGNRCRAIVVDLSRKALRAVVLRAYHLGVVVDGILNEGEQVIDGHTQACVDRGTALEIEHTGNGVVQHNDIERIDVAAETAALERERVGVELLCAPPLLCHLQLRDVLSGAGRVAARCRGDEQYSAGESL